VPDVAALSTGRTATVTREALANVMQRHGGLGLVCPLELPKLVDDHADKFLVHDASARRSAVVAVSPPNHPRTQWEAAKRAAAARRALGPRIGAAVLVPWHVGETDGVYYTVTPYREPISDARPLRALQRRSLRAHLLQWLAEATARTVRATTPDETYWRFVVPLQAVVEDPRLGGELRHAASVALADLDAGRWQPRLVLAHNDLWEGNVLRAQGSPFEWSFSIIDWGGSRTDGWAIYDLVRLALSFGLSRRALARRIEEHAQLLGCAPRYARHHLVAALAGLALEPGSWPLDRFAVVAEQCLGAVP
jgi:hypothetical protein